VMQHVLLTATAAGLATSFLSQPFETAQTRDAVERIFDGIGQPHTLLRIGYGQPTATTARRPVADVMTCRATPVMPAR